MGADYTTTYAQQVEGPSNDGARGDDEAALEGRADGFTGMTGITS